MPVNPVVQKWLDETDHLEGRYIYWSCWSKPIWISVRILKQSKAQ